MLRGAGAGLFKDLGHCHLLNMSGPDLLYHLSFLNNDFRTLSTKSQDPAPQAISPQTMASTVQPVETVYPYRPPESTSGTLTSWIPLVTPYSGHAPQCSTKFWQWATDRELVAWDPGFGISVSKDLRCVPEAATTVWDQDRLGSNSDTIVSIGPITCPEAFSQVATSVIDASRTMVACCPL